MLNNKKSSVQQLLGLETFSRHGLKAQKTETVYFSVSPSNIAVLSNESLERKIDKLTALMTAFPDIEIICTDGCECFDNNKVFLDERIAAEDNEAVKQLLIRDRDFIDGIQAEMSNSRQFFFAYRFHNQSEDMINTVITRIEKTLTEYDFVSRRLEKSEIKQMLAIYFGVSAYGDEIPDFEAE